MGSEDDGFLILDISVQDGVKVIGNVAFPDSALLPDDCCSSTTITPLPPRSVVFNGRLVTLIAQKSYCFRRCEGAEMLIGGDDDSNEENGHVGMK